MKATDLICPICGAINYSLILDETDGWMECEHCGTKSHLLRADDLYRREDLPVAGAQAPAESQALRVSA